jgi:nuclear factor erythroid 2-related factor 1/3
MDEIIDTSVEEFTELLTRYRLTDAQQQLVRDIRRRGKNKMAAQNCRKRKMEVIQTIEDEVRVV